MLDKILAALGPAAGQAADLVLAELQAQKATILAAANAAGVKAIDELANLVIANLPHGGFAAIVAPIVAKAIKNAEPQIVAAAGGEEAALEAALEAWIAAFAKQHGG